MGYFLKCDVISLKNTGSSEDDDDVVRAAKKNRAAFAALYEKYVDRVFHYVYNRVGNVVEAEDLTSQVFEDAINSLSKYYPRGHFAGWLFTIAYRRCADFHRNPRVDTITEGISSDLIYDPVEQVVCLETIQHLEQLLNELREEDRELLRLHFAAELTYGEMADVLGKNESAVKMAMSRLIQRLKSRWEVENG